MVGASGSQARTLSCTEARRCNSRAEGSVTGLLLPDSIAMRSSTLPRLSCAPNSSRKAGSDWRSSSGRRKVRSRKRLLTARISRPNELADAPLVSPLGLASAVRDCTDA